MTGTFDDAGMAAGGGLAALWRVGCLSSSDPGNRCRIGQGVEGPRVETGDARDSNSAFQTLCRITV